jgi:hypothetical protein
MNATDLIEVYRRIACGEEKHVDFLTRFAEAFCYADPENRQILYPSARLLAYKYNLTPGIPLNTPNSLALEQLAVVLAMQTESKGVVMVILHRNQRAEVVAGLLEDAPDLAEVLQKLADQVKDGDGMRIGRDGHTIHQT